MSSSERKYLAQIRGLDQWLRAHGNLAKLSISARGALVGIYGIFDRAGWPDVLEMNVDDFAAMLGINRRTFLSVQGVLVELGFFEVIPGTGQRPNGYRLQLFSEPERGADELCRSAGFVGIVAFWSAAGLRVNDYVERILAKVLRQIGPERLARGILELHKEGRLSVDEIQRRAFWNGDFGEPEKNARAAGGEGDTDYDFGVLSADEDPAE